MNYRLATKPILFLSALLIFETTLFAQVKFEKGYIIDKDNQRIECLIKNTDTRKTPHSFSYRLTEESKTVTVTPTDVREVSISGYGRYISAKVKMDRSNDYANDIDQLSSSRDPNWKEETLFLKVVVDGKAATLFVYRETDFLRFFYRKENAPVEQLVYKAFRVNQAAYDYNKEYLNQLGENVSCTSSDPAGRKPDYNEGDLEKYFIAFNTCNGSPVAAAPKPPKTKHFSIMLLAGAEHTSLQAEDHEIGTITRFDSKTNPILGAEMEYSLPNNRNKVSVVLSIHSSTYKSNGKDSVGEAQVTYGSIVAGIGPRYRFFCGDDFSIFLDALYLGEFKTSGSYHWKEDIPNIYATSYSVAISTASPALAVGAGCTYKNLSAELRYVTTKEIFPNGAQYASNFKRLSLTVKYRILNF